ncbi:MAG TPA: tRNA glutamyl-Q(34) synthetase GluQRS [Steroidobacteraceae bacterium]|nr:tRNA glutamyl-Q(34) synthetase GluQRS [Steroidobacteraceae bacterium]
MNAARSSTATGTTATASTGAAARRGRFAPTPSGLLHKGSLLAAVASWLDARAQGHAWLVRMEDLDTPRVVPGMADAILATLDRFGLHPDGPVLFQSTRTAAYREALQSLIDAGRAYACRCRRGERTGAGSCRCRGLALDGSDCAWRLHIDSPMLAFEDAIQGPCSYATAVLGDPVLFRRDGIAAYQLAVVVDDAFQGITDVVRGADLLESTAWQVAVGAALGLPQPHYAHVPVLTEPGGAKLAKSRRSLPLDGLDPQPALAEILSLLGISLPEELKAAPVSDMLHWSVPHWSPVRMTGIRAMALPN